MLKFFANVVTFGAIAKVEASRDCFNYAKSDYESKLNQYEMALKNYESNKAKLDVLLSELKSHKKSLIKNNGTYAMKHLEKNGNEILSCITKNIPLKLENVSALAVYEGQIDPADNFNNFDSIAATLIMGPFGIIGAHGSADETVEENNKRIKEIIEASSNLTKAIVTIENENGILIKFIEAAKYLSSIIKKGLLK